MTGASSSLDALTNAVAESFSAPALPPPCMLIDVAHYFAYAMDMLVQVQERGDIVAIEFDESICHQYSAEQARFTFDNTYHL